MAYKVAVLAALFHAGQERTPCGVREDEDRAQAGVLGVTDTDQPATKVGNLNTVAVVRTPGTLPPAGAGKIGGTRLSAGNSKLGRSDTNLTELFFSNEHRNLATWGYVAAAA